MDKSEAKKIISHLVEKYELKKKSNLISKYTEEETKKDFILPVFKALGWDVDDKKEVTAEEHQSSGRVDYGFYLDSRLKFYLEAKSLGSNLHKEEFANQAIKYSWNKGATWAILTDFESIKVFNAQDIERSLGDKLFFEIPYTQYLERFDQLWLLSKDSFEQNLLDKEAEKVGKKFQKVAVSTLLYKDLDNCRQILTHDLAQWNQGLDKDLLDEGVQKLLDRLIFLRVAEDRNIEPPTLIPLIRDWENNGRKGRLYESMIQKFRELDPIYNSSLFSEHPFENWEEYSGATEKVINILYGKNGYYEYDFKAMPADVLGTVYENYLGYRLNKSKKGISIGKDAKKRKEHGIYYTPTFIVDYIVKNTLKPVLDKCYSVGDLKKIKVLDPACGSGSFLIKALETIYNKYLEFGNNGGVFTKLDILLNNIYGVDLDPQAVEITRLNLLINALDQRMRLPGLEKNIRNGNSLISGTDEELTKYFGKSFRDKKPFNWEEEFPEVFEQGGFDVVIGNPPWGAEINNEEKIFYKQTFKCGKGIIDTFALFIEKVLNLLKQSGCLGFILPDIILLKDYPCVRKMILDTCNIMFLKYSGMAFKGVNLDSVTMVVLKENDLKIRNNNIINIDIDDHTKHIVQNLFVENTDYKFNLYFDPSLINLKNKLDKISIPLGGITEIHEGVHSGNIRDKLFTDTITSENSKKLLFKGVELAKYGLMWGGKYVDYNNQIIDKQKGEYANLGRLEYFDNQKILVRRTGDHILAALDLKKYVVSNNFFVVYLTKEKNVFNVELKYILGVLNSKLATWYFTAIQPRKGRLFAEIKINHLKEIPVNLNCDKTKLISLVDKITQLQETIVPFTLNSEKWKNIKSEIEKIDIKINQEVYKLYGLTDKEIKIVEESTK